MGAVCQIDYTTEQPGITEVLREVITRLREFAPDMTEDEARAIADSDATSIDAEVRRPPGSRVLTWYAEVNIKFEWPPPDRPYDPFEDSPG